MKIFKIFLVVFFSLLLLGSTSFAAKNIDSRITDKVMENLMEGINSDNLGLKLSATYYLGEYACCKAVIPLLKILKSDDREEARIAAALALYKINDDRGIFAVKQAIRFDDSERVKKLCALFYCEHSKPVDDSTTVYANK